ncbi:MAG: ADP-ribosylglycohydrolase family protein [Phycisphaerales bacterium]|jgi:ADP-ribosylglycohydrolase|nr:ADP-ribosylglycohydrolase family protein [Phycisphaerales bacterium]
MADVMVNKSGLGSSIRERINACWLGKSIGGTLGMPFEGNLGPIDVWFYTPVPKAMLPNDDLDLQVVWACVLRDMANPVVSRHVLADAWERHVEFPFDEYAAAKRNMRLGLKPPQTGAYDNWFANGMGAAIRSELWACLAPATPELAAAYAYEDACVDHAGEGVWAAMFLAALQSLAFVESDPEVLLDQALRRIPRECLIHQAVTDVRRWMDASDDWMAIRRQILERYDHENFTDVTANIAFTVMAWLLAPDDFGQAICIANNCGRDTDCTAATVGALMGIINPASIPAKWIEPLGNKLVLSPEIVNLSAPPQTLDELTDLVINLHRKIDSRRPPVEDHPSIDMKDLCIKAKMAFVGALPINREAIERLPEGVWSEVRFDGTMGRLSAEEFKDDVLLLKFPVNIETPQRVRIMFNTAQPCRVWIDGAAAFEREKGIVSPSLHRSVMLANQHKDLELGKGLHVVTAAVRRSASGGAAWNFGVGRSDTQQWLPHAIYTIN